MTFARPATFFAVLALTGVATEAHATTGPPIADLKISDSTAGPFKKNDKYTSQGLFLPKQSATKTVTAHNKPVPKFRSFYVKSQLDGGDGSSITLYGTPDVGGDCFLVFYLGPGFASADDVTPAVTGAGLTKAHQPGKTRKWRISVGAANGCDPGDELAVTLAGRTPPNAADDDIVLARLKVV